MANIPEEALLALAVKNKGGGGGTTNYNDLSNQPQINGNTLTGNKSASDLGLADSDTVDGILDGTNIDSFADVETALAGKQNALTAGSHIAIDDDTISVNRWAVPAGKVVYTVITSDENYGQNVHVQRYTISGGFIDDRVYTIRTWENVTVDGLIYIEDRYTKFYITLLKDSDEQSAGYQYIVNPNTTPTSNSFTFMMEQEENDNDLIIRSELSGKVDKVDGKGLSTNDYTDADKAIVGGVTAALADKADKSAVKNEFIGTLDEWNALTVEQRKAYDTYQIKGDYTEGSGGLPDYSTTEQKTGQKWIDGRDIYSKTEQYTIPSDVAVGITKFQTAIPTNASVLNAEVRVEIETGILSIASYTPWWTSATTIYAGLDSSGVGIYFGGNFYAGKPIYVTLFYVKTA